MREALFLFFDLDINSSTFDFMSRMCLMSGELIKPREWPCSDILKTALSWRRESLYSDLDDNIL